MAGVNAYGATSNSNAIWDTDKKGNAVVKSDSNLNMDDFLNMLTAQMSNQDPMNPSTDMEFIGQMAQFTSLQAMKTLTELSMAQHGSTLIGKHVIVAHVDDRGQLVNEKGVVSNVKFMGGMVTLTVNGNEYEMSSVMEILTEEEFNKPAKPPVEGGDDAGEKDDADDSTAGKTDGTNNNEASKARSANVNVLSDSAYATAANDATATYTSVASATSAKDTTTNVVHSKEERAVSDVRAAQLAVNDPELYAQIKPYLDGGYILGSPVSMDYNTLRAGQAVTEVQSDSKVQTPVGEVNVQSAESTTATPNATSISQAESNARASQLAVTDPELYEQIKAYLDQGYKLAPGVNFDYNALTAKETDKE